ncbi:MAG: ATP-grasp domain-containing protein [Candidatus Thorarchaeota archaeon]
MNQNKIFIFEYVSGGGFNNIELPSSLFCEGFAMLRSLISDFKRIDYEISTLLDHRITSLTKYLNADFIDVVNPDDNFISKFKENMRQCKYCFIIAPEFSNILYNLTKIAFMMNKVILSVKLEGIQLASSKFLTYNYFKTYSVLTPTTYSIPYKESHLDLNFILQKLNEINKPIIIKPNDGVGAELIYYFESRRQIENFFHSYEDKFDLSRKFILQEYISGDDLSISLLIYRDSNPLIISVNSQFINIKETNFDSQYFGGYTPVENFYSIKAQIQANLKKLDLTKFNSFLGIDFIKNKQNLDYFIEINPRLTTSYIGIRNVIKTNLVELMLTPDKYDFDHYDLEPHYFSKFCRLELERPDDKNYAKNTNNIITNLMKNIPELITPPISFSSSPDLKNQKFSCFIATKTKDQESSNSRIKQIFAYLKNQGFRVLNGE